jgi:hypothetical protein
VGLGRLAAGILGSNPALGMNVCPRSSMLCCPECDWKYRQTEKGGKGNKKESKKKKEKSAKRKWLFLLIRIREILGLNLGPETGSGFFVFCSFPQSLKANAGIVPQMLG